MRRLLPSAVKAPFMVLAALALVPVLVACDDSDTTIPIAQAPVTRPGLEQVAAEGQQLAADEMLILERGDAERGKKIYTEGKGTAPACMTCHGEKGLGDDIIGAPRLADQGFTYIRKQLQDYASGARTDNTAFIMNMVAQELTEQDYLDLAAYEIQLDQPATASASDMSQIKEMGQVPVGIRHEGKIIALYGIADQGVPACQSCHQYNGRGAFPIYPVIGGQRYTYLVKQLTEWRSGERQNDLLGQMQAVARNMTDEDIYNVATYLTSAPPRPMGTPHEPPQSPPPVSGPDIGH